VHWRQLKSKLFVNMVGGGSGEGGGPEYTLQLDADRMGTRVTMSYWFDRVSIEGWLCLVTPCMPAVLHRTLLSRSQVVWEADMLRRGYEPTTEEALRSA
jgi:hypothetical protein